MKTLPEGFIDDHPNALDWNVVSGYQPLTPYLINKYNHLINYSELAFNTNLPSESIVMCIDKMDFATSQQYNKYTTEMIRNWIDILDHDIVIMYQKLDEDTMALMLTQDIANERWMIVKNKIDNMLRYQTMSVGMIMGLQQLETDDIELVDMELLIKNQKLPEFFIEKLVNSDPEFLEIVFKYQKLSEYLIKSFITNVSPETVMSQELSEKLILDVVNVARLQQNVDVFKEVLLKMCDTQKFGSQFLDEIDLRTRTPSRDNIDTSLTEQSTHIHDTVNLRENKEFMRKLYTKLFMRTLDPEDPNWINWDLQVVNECITPFLSWSTIVRQRFTETQIDSLITMAKDSDYKHTISWYVLLRYNTFTQKQLEVAINTGLFGAVEAWLSTIVCKLDVDFANKMQKYKKWWNHVESDKIPEFSRLCMECIEISSEYDDCIDDEYIEKKNSILLFIKDFIYNTDWTTLLRDEKLPEWFIWVFGKASDKINRKLNGVDYWWKISRYQSLSSEFIKFHINNSPYGVIICPKHKFIIIFI